MWSEVKGWWSTHPWIDVAGTAVLVAAAVVVHRVSDLPVDVFQRVPRGERAGLLLGIAQVVGIVNAFSLVALTFMQAASGERMRVLRRTVGRPVTLSWLLAILGSLVAVGVLVVVALIGAAGGPEWMLWAAQAAVLFIGPASLRLGWVFVQVVLIDLADSGGEQEGHLSPPIVVRRSQREEGDVPSPPSRRRDLSELERL